jgi:hypothetical protein
MKTLNSIFTLTLTLLLNGVLYSQNITGTLGTNGVFKIKDASNDYLILSQTNGNLSLFRNMELGGDSVSTSTRGVITKNGRRFIHNYQAPGTNGFNTFIGLDAGNFTMSGTLFSASRNTGVGYQSLFLLTTGYENSAFGNLSLYSNTTGRWNSALGNEALYSNTTGGGNSAFGRFSLYSNTTGSYNSAFGWGSLAFNITGNYNTSIGDFAGINIETGSNNIAIGYNTQVPSGSGDNQIRLGNTAITYAGIQVAWTVTSDRRYKENINPIGLGLGFISKLNPVSYQRKNDENKKTEYGLIAQEVEEVLKELGIENHAMLTITDEGMYELRYNDLIAPMIKAIQELKEQNEQLKKEKDIEIAYLKNENDNEIANLKVQNEKLLSELKDKETRISSVESQLQEILQVVNELKSKEVDIKNVNIGVK